jgi:hypothetical protein
MITKDDWEFWYYNRVNEFSEKIISSFKDNEPTINDLVKNEQESNRE